jgi:hypothetical protein
MGSLSAPRPERDHGTSNVPARRLRVEWSGTAKVSPRRLMIEPINPSVWRRASRVQRTEAYWQEQVQRTHLIGFLRPLAGR